MEDDEAAVAKAIVPVVKDSDPYAIHATEQVRPEIFGKVTS